MEREEREKGKTNEFIKTPEALKATIYNIEF